MDVSQWRDVLTQVQAGARVSTAVGEPIPVGERVVIPVVQIAYGGGGGGGQRQAGEPSSGGGGGVRIRPLGCWVIGPDSERWVPSLDVNRLTAIAGSIIILLLLTIRALAKCR